MSLKIISGNLPIALILLFGLLISPTQAFSADEATPQDSTSSETIDSLNNEAAEEEVAGPLESLSNLLETRKELNEELKAIVKELKRSDNEVEAQEIKKMAEEIQQKINNTDAQINLLATGVSESEFELGSLYELDLEEEVQKLLRPLVIMLQSVTADAREIENLRFQLSTTEQQAQLAKQAMERLEPLLKSNEDSTVHAELEKVKETWQKRLAESLDKKEALSRQLETFLNKRDIDSESTAQGFWDFLSQRGRNLVLGITAFIIVFFLVRKIGSFAVKLQTKPDGTRGFGARLTSLIVNVLSIIAAIVATLMVFNFFNDWLLTAIVLLASFALVWSLIKTLPGLVEQVTLLLNLGAVQEGERVVYNGIPWRVKRLDFYSEFENPALTGGEFTVPVRELIGLHSRPSGRDEAFFPCMEGDWLELQDGIIGQVVIQTPGYVEVVELGGAKHTYPTDAFLGQIPKNYSVGYRVEVEFGIDYSHQSIATNEVIVQMRDFVEQGLLKRVERAELVSVEVEFIRSGASSLDYIVEAEFVGSTAERYEELEREVARLLVDCCNHHGWTIPYQQIVLHQAKD